MTKKASEPAKASHQADVEDFCINEQAFAADVAAANIVDAATRALGQEQLDMNQLLGRIQATTAIATLLDTLSLAQIAQIKENKEYRKFQGQVVIIDGVEIRLDTWDGFCKAIGSSRQNIEEKLDNLQVLGEAALERAQELGMTTRELRRLRKLGDDDKKVVIGELEVAVGDKDAIVDLITEMAAKHAKDKEALQKQLDDNAADAKASERIMKDKEKRIADLQKQIVKQENRTTEDAQQDTLLAAHRAQIDCLKVIPGLDDALAALLAYEDNTLTLKAANILHEIRGAIEDLQIKYGLTEVAPVDDSWITPGGFADEPTELQ